MASDATYRSAAGDLPPGVDLAPLLDDVFANDGPMAETFAVIDRVLTDNKQMLATTAGRRALLCEVVRLATARNYEALSESRGWRLHAALIATLGSTRSGVSRARIAASPFRPGGGATMPGISMVCTGRAGSLRSTTAAAAA